MAMKWTEETAQSTIKKNANNVSISGKVIRVGDPGPGLKVWGAIDYLCKYKGYTRTQPDLVTDLVHRLVGG